MEYAACQFCLYYFVLLVSLTLCERFADAEDNLQAVSKSQLNLLLQDFWCLVIVLATL